MFGRPNVEFCPPTTFAPVAAVVLVTPNIVCVLVGLTEAENPPNASFSPPNPGFGPPKAG